MLRLRSLFLALLSLVALLGTTLAPGAAQAQAKPKQKIQVLTIYSNSAYTQAEALSIALKRVVDRSRDWSLGKGDFSLEVLTAALACDEVPDAACLQKIAKQIDSERFVWGQVEKQGSQISGTIYFESPEGREQTAVSYSENLTDASDEALLQVAQSAFLEITGAAPGKLKISAEHAQTVIVDDEAARKLTNGSLEFDLPGGEHQLTFSAPGYASETRTIQVVAGQLVEVRLSLRQAAGGGVDGSLGADTGAGMSTRKVIGIGTMGVGAVLLAGSVYSALQVNGVNNDESFGRYRSSVAQGEDVCELAKAGRRYPSAPDPSGIADQCSKASTFQTLQWVFAGAGVVAGGVGAYLFFGAEDEPATARRKPRLDTRVGSGGGYMSLSLPF